MIIRAEHTAALTYTNTYIAGVLISVDDDFTLSIGDQGVGFVVHNDGTDDLVTQATVVEVIEDDPFTVVALESNGWKAGISTYTQNGPNGFEVELLSDFKARHLGVA